MKKKNVILFQNPERPTFTLKDKNRNHLITPLLSGYIKALAYKYKFLDKAEIHIVSPSMSDLAGDSLLINEISKLNPDVVWHPAMGETSFGRFFYIIKKLKEKNPELISIITGSIIPNSADNLNSIPHLFKGLNLGVFSRKSETIVQILNCVTQNNLSFNEIPGVIYFDENRVSFNSITENYSSIYDIPSPYLLGFLNDSLENESIWMETKRGCPYTCDYCYQGAFPLRQESYFPLDKIEKELMLFIEKGIKTVNIFDSTFNFPAEWMGQICDIIKRVNIDRSLQFDIAIRAELIDKITAKLFKRANIYTASVGFQSQNPDVLSRVGRKNVHEKWLNGIKLLKDNVENINIHLILGLPGDTPSSFKNTLEFLVEEGLNNNTLVFNLILSPTSRLFGEKENLGLLVQKEPPFMVLQTPSFSFNDFKEALSYSRECGTKSILESENEDSFPLLTTHFKDGLNNKNKIEEELPYTKVIIKTDSKIINTEHISKISQKLANSVVLWFTGSRPEDNCENILKTMEIFSRENPYNIWNIVIDSPDGLNYKLIEKIKTSIQYYPTNLDYEAVFKLESMTEDYFRVSTRFFVIHSFLNSKIIEGCINFYRLDLGRENDFIDVLKLPFDGFLIKSDNLLDRENLFKVFAEIRENNWQNKVILFENWYYQCIYNKFFLREDKILGQEENIIKINLENIEKIQFCESWIKL